MLQNNKFFPQKLQTKIDFISNKKSDNLISKNRKSTLL